MTPWSISHELLKNQLTEVTFTRQKTRGEKLLKFKIQDYKLHWDWTGTETFYHQNLREDAHQESTSHNQI